MAQCAAEQAGLLWVTSIAARRTFPLATLRLPACSHWTITAWLRGCQAYTPRQVLKTAGVISWLIDG